MQQCRLYNVEGGRERERERKRERKERERETEKRERERKEREEEMQQCRLGLCDQLQYQSKVWTHLLIF